MEVAAHELEYEVGVVAPAALVASVVAVAHELEDDVQPRKGGSSRWHVVVPQRGVALHVVDHPSVFDHRDVGPPNVVAPRHVEPLKSCVGTVLEEESKVGDGACHPYGLDSHPRLASSLVMTHLPIHGVSLAQPKQVFRHCARLRQPQQRPKQKQAQELHPLYHQEQTYLDGEHMVVDEDIQISEKPCDCLQSVELLVEGCLCDQKEVEGPVRVHSCCFGLVGGQKIQDQYN